MLNFFDRREFIEPLCTKYPFMRRFFCRLEPLVFANTLSTNTDETVLVLSPNDYWALAVNLNVKTEKEAVKYAPALFDQGDEYRYEAQKTGQNSYVLIAYNPNELSQMLLTLPNVSMIKKITFAQWVFAQETRPVHLPSGKYLATLDGIVIEMDASYVNASTSIELDEALAQPRPFLKTVAIEELLPSPLTQKTLKITFLILLLLLGNLATQALFSYQESANLTAKMTEILETSKLPQTSIEREAVLGALMSKETKQLHFRKICKEISNLPVESKIIPPPTTPNVSTAPSSSVDGIILIPGSKPGEANRLLVENNSSAAEVISFRGEGIQELTYDGNAINLIIDTHDSTVTEKLKNEIIKHFNHPQFNNHNTQLEVRIK